MAQIHSGMVTRPSLRIEAQWCLSNGQRELRGIGQLLRQPELQLSLSQLRTYLRRVGDAHAQGVDKGVQVGVRSDLDRRSFVSIAVHGCLRRVDGRYLVSRDLLKSLART